MPSEAMSREIQRARDRERERETDRDRDTETETDRDRQRELVRDSERQTDRQIKTNERARCSHSAKATKADVRQILQHKNP